MVTCCDFRFKVSRTFHFLLIVSQIITLLCSHLIGVWVAHGEGRVYFPQEATLQHTLEHHLAPLRFVDDQNSVTEEYPFNPSGSTHGELVCVCCVFTLCL